VTVISLPNKGSVIPKHHASVTAFIILQDITWWGPYSPSCFLVDEFGSLKSELLITFIGSNWWPRLTCTATWPIRWCLCLNLRPQYKHGCLGSWPHSRRICLRREIIQRYTFLHLGHENSCSLPSTVTSNPAVCCVIISSLISTSASWNSPSTSNNKWPATVNKGEVSD
jgi:hypothetical protein